jgi:hypothetical protein
MAICGSPLMINLSSWGPGLPFRRFGFGFFGISYYYHIGSCLGRKWSPSRGSDPDDRIGHASANRVCLPIPALGDTIKH